MGWPTKGTGKNYNSHTGFGCFVGAYSKKVLCSHIYCRRCRIREVVWRKFTPVREHDCIQNWNKSSKSMEAACIVYLAINCVTLRLFVMRNIISDDDSTMRAHARHPQAEKGAKDKGKLPPWIF